MVTAKPNPSAYLDILVQSGSNEPIVIRVVDMLVRYWKQRQEFRLTLHFN